MRYLLDTDHASILERPGGADYPPLVANLNLHVADGVGVSVVSLHEQVIGAHEKINQARSPDELVRGYALLFGAIELFRHFPLVPFDPAAAAAVADLKARKVRVKAMDMRIAAVALARSLTLVTRNARDFVKVPGLRIEDWTK